MNTLNCIKHASKNEFPTVFQEYYHNTPVKLRYFPININETCILIPTGIIDSNCGLFSNPNEKKVDEIYHCNSLGLIENKTGNYSSSQITQKFTIHKAFIEKKYRDFQSCRVGYCVLKAKRLSEKLQREFKVTRGKELYFYNHPKKKKFEIENCPVYFVRSK